MYEIYVTGARVNQWWRWIMTVKYSWTIQINLRLSGNIEASRGAGYTRVTVNTAGWRFDSHLEIKYLILQYFCSGAEFNNVFRTYQGRQREQMLRHSVLPDFQQKKNQNNSKTRSPPYSIISAVTHYPHNYFFFYNKPKKRQYLRRDFVNEEWDVVALIG